MINIVQNNKYLTENASFIKRREAGETSPRGFREITRIY